MYNENETKYFRYLPWISIVETEAGGHTLLSEPMTKAPGGGL